MRIMMSGATEMPNWSLLTSDPMAFFELNAGFDRKDLKRAYGKLIKEFKRSPIRPSFNGSEKRMSY